MNLRGMYYSFFIKRTCHWSFVCFVREQCWSRVGAVVRALASHQCVPGSIPGPGVICGLSLLLVLYSAPRGFSPGTPVFPSHQKPALLNSNSIWKQWMKSHLVEIPLQIPIIIIIIIIIIINVSLRAVIVMQSMFLDISKPKLHTCGDPMQ